MRTFAERPKATQQTKLAKSTISDQAHFWRSREVNSMLQLPRTIGNHAVQRMMRSNAEEVKKVLASTALAYSAYNFSQIPGHRKLPVQAKLKINTPGDIYEQEADRVSDEVMRMPEPLLQRKCACGGACADCQKDQSVEAHEWLQMKCVGGSGLGSTEAPPIVHEVLRSAGQPLDAATRAYFEPRFRHDFSKVRVHFDSVAEQSAQDVGAHAYTVGHDMVFGSGSFAPRTGEGRRLIAHELAHVAQHTSASTLQRDPKKKEKPIPQDFAVLLDPDKDFVTLATAIAPGAKVLHATSVEDLAKQLKAIKVPIGTLYFVAHMNEDGDLLFTSPGKMTYVPAEAIASKIKDSTQVESIDFRGCNVAQAPAEMDKIRVSLKASKVTGSTCTLVKQIADPITIRGKQITQPKHLTDKNKAAFDAGFKKVRKLFLDNRKKCIINDSVDGYFQTGGKLIAVWANPGSMADDAGWDDRKSICYEDLKVEKVDPTEKLPVIDPDDCKLVELGKKQP